MTQKEFFEKADALYEKYEQDGAGSGAFEFLAFDLAELLLSYKGVED